MPLLTSCPSDTSGQPLAKPSRSLASRIRIPKTLSDAEEHRVGMALAGRAARIFEKTGLYIVCAVLDPTAR